MPECPAPRARPIMIKLTLPELEELPAEYWKSRHDLDRRQLPLVAPSPGSVMTGRLSLVCPSYERDGGAGGTLQPLC